MRGVWPGHDDRRQAHAVAGVGSVRASLSKSFLPFSGREHGKGAREAVLSEAQEWVQPPCLSPILKNGEFASSDLRPGRRKTKSLVRMLWRRDLYRKDDVLCLCPLNSATTSTPPSPAFGSKLNEADEAESEIRQLAASTSGASPSGMSPKDFASPGNRAVLSPAAAIRWRRCEPCPGWPIPKRRQFSSCTTSTAFSAAPKSCRRLFAQLVAGQEKRDVRRRVVSGRADPDGTGEALRRSRTFLARPRPTPAHRTGEPPATSRMTLPSARTSIGYSMPPPASPVTKPKELSRCRSRGTTRFVPT